MQNCLPSFFAIGASIGPQADAPDPGLRNLADTQRRASRVPIRFVEQQPSRMNRPVPQYRRFSAYEKRRAEAPLAGPGHAQKTFAQLRKTKSAPTSPEVHRDWVGYKENGRQWEERRGSNPIWPSDPMLIIAAPSDENEQQHREHRQSLQSLPPRVTGPSASNITGRWSPASLSSHPREVNPASWTPPPRPSQRAIESSPTSITGKWTPASLSSHPFVSPIMHQDGRDSPPIPFPPLEPLDENHEFNSGDITTAQEESPYSALGIMVGPEASETSDPAPASRPRGATRARSQTVRSRADTTDSLPRSKSASSSPRQKRVSFSPELDEVIHFRTEPEHEPEEVYRPMPLFSGFLPISGIAISRPPIAASSPLKRQSSLPSIRGHAAQAPVGRGILKRSNTVDAAMILPEEPNPSRVEFDGWDSPVPSSAGSSPALSSRPSSVSSSGSTSSSYSNFSAASSASSASSFAYEEAVIETRSRSNVQMTKGKAEQVVISPTSRSKKAVPEDELSDLGVRSPEIGSQSPRHWSMAGVGVWVAKDGTFEYEEYSQREHDEFPFPRQQPQQRQARPQYQQPQREEMRYTRAPSPLAERQYNRAPVPLGQRVMARSPPPLPPRVTALRA